MSTYHYRAYNADGETVTGALDTSSLGTLEARLRTAGLWLLDAREGGAGAKADDSRVSRVKLKRRDQITFFIQMSLLLRAGITLPNALDRLAEDFRGTPMGEVTGTMASEVMVGTPLHQAMALFPRVFSREVVAMIQAGEVSGRMPEVFNSLSGYFEWLDGLVAEIRQALIYPIIVMLAASGLVLLLFTFVVPRFVGLLNDLSLEVPMLTRIVMGISDALLRGWPVLLPVLIGVPVGLKIALRVPAFARQFDRRLMQLPVFGSLIAMFALSRFAQNLAMLYAAGIPLLKGLEICRGLVGNRALSAALEDVRLGVLEGQPMSKCMQRHDVFPNTVVTMITTGESSGHLDTALSSISEYYNNVIPRRIKVVFAIFNPAMMLTLIGIVGVVALSVILPILQLWNVR
jgi:type IV pilus assembly protein PilC